MNNWRQMTLGEICLEGGGFIRTGPFGSQLHQSDYVNDPGGIPVVMPKDMSGGRIDRASIARIDQNTASRLAQHLLDEGDIVLSRRGDVGRSAWVGGEDLPVLCGTGSMRVHPGEPVSVSAKYLRYFFRSRLSIDYLEGQAVGATMPNLNAGIVTGMPVPVLPPEKQQFAVEVLTAIENLMENGRRRVELLEEMARGIYREWFVRFGYPTHEDAALVDSPLGPIPQGWVVRAVAALAASQRHAVTGGPFGSKLGRKDYVDAGVPVIRGANLSVGGGWDETDLVFVSERKAAELASSTARRGDVVITQRGTLGQVGLIPKDSAFDRYVLSQSQMKITIDETSATAEFIYNQFRAPETTARFIAQAMTAGVPHVNLKLLRDFQLIAPPRELQAMFSQRVRPLNDESWRLRRQADRLRDLRDLLLPRLVTGQIDVSSIDLEALAEGSAA